MPFLYRPPIDRLISGLKFQGKLGNGRLLSMLLVDFLERNRVDLPDIIVPVPLHWKRVAGRGFNQSMELARPVSAHFHLPLDSATCVRRQATVPQITLEKRSRLRNIKGAFDLRRDIGARHVVLLDDVVTTGATVSELAAQLLQRGAERVDVWALARTP